MAGLPRRSGYIVLVAMLAAFVSVMPVIVTIFIPLMAVIVIIIPMPNAAGSSYCYCKHCAPSQGHNNFSHDVPPVLVDVCCVCWHHSGRKMNGR